jgi:RND family efflux transporter MFP subunit
MRSARGLLALAAISLLLAGCGRDAPEAVETETVVPVTTQAARTGDVRATIHATGTVTPAPGADQLVTAPESARIVALPKAEGDHVRRGDLLVRFEIPSLSADAASKTAEVDRARARLENAKAAQTRAHDLFDRGVAARKEVEDADRERSDAEAALREADAGRRASATLAARTEVHALFDGIVATRTHNPGDVVDASATDPILRVIDPSRLEVVAAVPLSDIANVETGAAARLLLPGGEEPEALKVISRPAAVQAQTGTAPVRLAFLRRTSLPAGTPVQVDIDGPLHTGVVVVPTSAIVREGDEAAVFVDAGGKAQRRPVTLGVSGGERVEVRSGLRAGEMVIVSGQNGLPDGTAVTAAVPGAK